jgi:hypothetical protein
MTELGDQVRDAVQGRTGADALAAFAEAFRSYCTAHPGRYAATVAAEATGPELLQASARVLDSIAAVLRGYDIDESRLTHAIRTLRCMFDGFATLQVGFQRTDDPEGGFEWMIHFVDRGLQPKARKAGRNGQVAHSDEEGCFCW